MSNVKNYTEQGGEKTVIGGVLEFTDDAVVKNLPKGDGTSWGSYVLPPATFESLGGVMPGPGLGITGNGMLVAVVKEQADFQADSTATTVGALKDDFNALLAKLRATGIMKGSE